jgi:hypothetical protein
MSAIRKIYAVVYPANASPKKIGPPDTAEPALWVVTKDGAAVVSGDVVGAAVEGALGRVSSERVRRHDARRSENEFARTGSCVEV